ncbi:uncharacterized protein LOC131241150 [Magnolia sinica]|uniref:uncharacterized protein LOC131241150 n=1 Tax=Magnolia sinica TaxID=86752 RepID=UPI002657B939|nr:uncharacterized protein LOC131241150 [Magnolia sinica]
MASGSSGRATPGAKGSDFDSDGDLSQRPEYGKDFWELKMGRSLPTVYDRQEESVNGVLSYTIENTMKKYADNLLQFLEGISGRLSQLELHCYSLEQSLGELRSDLARDRSETDMKLRSLENHLQEVHRFIQILRDKQDLAETQKELAKLQLMQKESTAMSRSQHSDDGIVPSAFEPKTHDNAPDAMNQQLALALPCQTTVPTSLPARAAEQQYQPRKELPIQQPIPPSLPAQQTIHAQSQPHIYHPSQNQLPVQTLQSQQQHHHDQHLQAGLQHVYQRPPMQDLPRQAPQQQPQPHVNQNPIHPFPPYQQQWPQQSPQQFPRQTQPQQPSPQASRSQTPPIYPPYPAQPANPLPETFPGSMQVQVPLSGVSQSDVNRPKAASYSYGEPGRTVPQQPPQHHNIQHQQLQPQINQSTYRAQLSDSGYPSAGATSQQPTLHGYMPYGTDGSRSPHPQHLQQSSYPPAHVSAVQNLQPPPSSLGTRQPTPQIMLNHPYRELIEKAASMGYSRDQAANVIHRMVESRQPVDFNSLLDRLNGQVERTVLNPLPW